MSIILFLNILDDLIEMSDIICELFLLFDDLNFIANVKAKDVLLIQETIRIIEDSFEIFLEPRMWGAQVLIPLYYQVWVRFDLGVIF